jgi:hypothetical protein
MCSRVDESAASIVSVRRIDPDLMITVAIEV